MKILYFPKNIHYLDLINYTIDIQRFQFMYKNVFNDVYITAICTNRDDVTWEELRRECSSVKRFYVLRKEDVLRNEELLKNINDINFKDIGM